MNGNKLKSIVTKKKIWMGTHNSMTYREPKYWYMKLFNIFSKCQNLYILDQIFNYDVIDLRVSYNKNGELEFRHGIVSYGKADIYFMLGVCNSAKQTKIVRVILEKIVNNRFEDCENFIDFCKDINRTYQNIIFIGGRRKFDWHLLYNFNANKYFPDNKIYQHVGSMAKDARWYEKIIPAFYAIRLNNFNKYHATEEGIHLFDFLD